MKFKANEVGKNRWTIPEDTLSLIRELSRQMTDQQIARLLNRRQADRTRQRLDRRARAFIPQLS